MKVIHQEKDIDSALESARREALAAFGSDEIFIEKYLENAKHIEIQVFVDSAGNVLHLYERECSVQRRHQKIIEEGPASCVPERVRSQMYEAARSLVGSTSYRGAATVEFLVEGDNFYLLEVNTRLQVEHPVTEQIVGFDLVKAQILTAQNNFVYSQHLIPPPRGHAIECRVYAENPYLGGVPSTGKLGFIRWPFGPHRRFEYGLEVGDSVTSYYDPMIAKIIVWDIDRAKAINKMKTTLNETVILGVHTNIPFLLAILNHPKFQTFEHSTQFISQYFSQPLPEPTWSKEELAWAQKLKQNTPRSNGNTRGNTPQLAKAWAQGWRLGLGG